MHEIRNAEVTMKSLQEKIFNVFLMNATRVVDKERTPTTSKIKVGESSIVFSSMFKVPFNPTSIHHLSVGKQQ
jgi:hypothetical protein